MRRRKKTNPFYHTKAWLLLRAIALARDNHLCQRCLKKHHLLTAATTVHHIKPIETHWHLRLVLTNLLSLCATCHNAEHPEKRARKPKRERRRRRARIIHL